MIKESKPYPPIEEEDGSCLSVREPAAEAFAYAEDMIIAHQTTIAGLPQSWEDLLECVAEGEQELERGEGIPWEVATQRIKKHISRYGS